MKRGPAVGLLPLYLELYDELLPNLRDGFAEFMAGVGAKFEGEGVRVFAVPICRVAADFEAAVREFEREGVDAIVTLHLAYSPSLESVDALCSTKLPIIILDTTMDAAFGIDVAPERLMYNHGIHGVMDLASMLRRRGRAYEIVAGHWRDSDVIVRAAEMARTPTIADTFSKSRLLRVGDAFCGMGDFSVAPGLLEERFGMAVEQVGLEKLDAAVEAIADEAVDAELAADRERFDCELDDSVHRRSIRVGLGLRRLLEGGGYHGFSVNFQEFDRADRAADTMPFLEISKAMARGIGYAGEGDVLTAALVGALARAFNEVTFTEVFCPDWSGDSLFLSHMGEISPSVAEERLRVVAKPAFDGKSQAAAVLTCAVRPGPAVFVNLAPGPGDTFSLVVAPVDVLPEDDHLHPKMRDTVRAWIRPRRPIADFLEAYSRAGGTHHSALILGDRSEAVVALARVLGVETRVIE